MGTSARQDVLIHHGILELIRGGARNIYEQEPGFLVRLPRDHDSKMTISTQ